jgi:hypothetical protein
MSDDQKPAGDPQPEADSAAATPSQAQLEESLAKAVDPADVVPVPAAMSPAEVDERAQVVEKLRRERDRDLGHVRREPDR